MKRQGTLAKGDGLYLEASHICFGPEQICVQTIGCRLCPALPDHKTKVKRMRNFNSKGDNWILFWFQVDQTLYVCLPRHQLVRRSIYLSCSSESERVGEEGKWEWFWFGSVFQQELSISTNFKVEEKEKINLVSWNESESQTLSYLVAFWFSPGIRQSSSRVPLRKI